MHVCALCQKSGFSLSFSLTKHKQHNQSFLFKTKCCFLKKNLWSHLYISASTFCRVCSHYVTETNWNYSNTRSKTQETPMLDNFSRFTNSYMHKHQFFIRCKIRVSFKINPVIFGSNRYSRAKVSIKHNIEPIVHPCDHNSSYTADGYKTSSPVFRVYSASHW